jgi:hypothetical protein
MPISENQIQARKVGLIKTVERTAWIQRLNVLCDTLLSMFGFNFNLRRYSLALVYTLYHSDAAAPAPHPESAAARRLVPNPAPPQPTDSDAAAQIAAAVREWVGPDQIHLWNFLQFQFRIPEHSAHDSPKRSHMLEHAGVNARHA